MHTRESLRDDLRRLGVKPGGILFVHSSFKSLGPVEGGAATVVGALEDAAGLLLMPSFNLVDKDKRRTSWNIASTPSTVGWLTEFFRQMPGTVRSDHFSHSVAARGKGAAEFVAGHLSREGMQSPWDTEPWGKTYGTHSPLIKAYEAGAQVLMLGVDYHSSTYMHVIEVLYWNREPGREYYWIDRNKLGAHWDTLGMLRRGKVGDADCRLFGAREFVDTLLAAVEREPARFFKYYPAI